MKSVKISRVEDILEFRGDVVRIEIEQDVIIKYIYYNKNSLNGKIDVDELRNVYAKSIRASYERKKYQDNVKINMVDIKKICFV